MPRALPDALLEGLAWDATGRRYRTLSELFDYSARVAAAVGAMMCVLMGVRDANALARACDLGVAMQLTNIARDVGEDARARRIYLPLDWLETAGLHPETIFADPLPDPRIRDMVRRLLLQADRLYFRAEAGIAALPLDARPGIYAARHVYAGIGGAIARNGFDTVSYRARTYKAQKIGWLGLSLARAAATTVMPGSAVLFAPPLDETRFLVEAAARQAPETQGRTDRLLGLFADLEARDRAMRGLERTGA
jgi:phytoene synthase